MVGFGLVMFWIFTAIFAGFAALAPMGPFDVISQMRNEVPGTPLPSPEEGNTTITCWAATTWRATCSAG
jgi:peptide/nickel transport system permease protein